MNSWMTAGILFLISCLIASFLELSLTKPLVFFLRPLPQMNPRMHGVTELDFTMFQSRNTVLVGLYLVQFAAIIDSLD